MNKPCILLAAVALTFMSVFTACQPRQEAQAEAVIEEPQYLNSNKVMVATSMGNFTIELLPEAAPKTVENFLKWVRQGFYTDTIFHRVKPGFVIQGGGLTQDMNAKPYKGSVDNEADLAKAQGLTNTRGTISMAYAPGLPLGAAVQFFINVRNNPNLDFKEKTLTGYGHCPFGKVIEGMDVVDKISKVKTGMVKGQADVPLETVTILKMEEVE
jgi:cyclophilin family peptidyl-prolyl cis-trans isomerase